MAHWEPARHAGGLVLAPGDYVLETPALRVVVGGMERRRATRGAVLEVAAHGAPAEDGLVLWAPALYLDDHARRLVTTSITPFAAEDGPGLRVTARSTIAGRTLDITRDLVLSGPGGTVYLTTRVTVRDGLPMRGVRVGGRIRWGGATPFAPGLGWLTDEGWHEATWIGVEGATASTVLGTDDSPLRVRAVYERHGDARFLQYTELVAPLHDISGHASLTDRRTLVATAGGLSSGVRKLGWARGAPYPEALVVFAGNLPSALIRIYTHDGKPVMRARPDRRGRAIIPFPPLGRGAARVPRYHVIGSVYGHATGDAVSIEPSSGGAVRVEVPPGGQMRIVARDESGRPLVARARLIGVGQTITPNLGLDSSAAGAGDTVLLADGSALVPLVPGRYRVLVSRGPEWTMHDETVEVSATFRPEVRARLSHVVDPREWVASDFHVHSAPSYDSQVTLEDRLTCFAAEGIRFATPTDHNYVTDYGPVLAERGIADFRTVTGVEVTTESPRYGHFNAFPFPVDTDALGNGAPEFASVPPGDLFGALHEVDPDTIVQVNHPHLEGDIGYFDTMGFDPRTGVATGPYSPDFDTMEVWNGFDLARVEAFDRMFTEWLELLGAGHRYVATGNSDSHMVRLQVVGYPRTYVRVPGGRVADGREVVRALREGRAFVTSGPFLEASVDGRGPGETAQVTGRVVRVRVIVRAPPWMSADDITLYVNGEVKKRAVVPPAPRPRPRRPAVARPVLRYDRTLEVPIRGDAFLVVMVRGRTPMGDIVGRGGALPIAFTNPIWIDHDGDGAVVIAPSR